MIWGIEKHSTLVHGEKTINKKELLEVIDGILVPKNKFRIDDFNNKEKMDLAVEIAEAMMQLYKARISDIPDDVIIVMERKIILDAFDKHWTKHLDIAGKLKSGIYLQQYAQNNPLAIYIEQATNLFNKMKINIANEVVENLANVILRVVEDEEQREERIEVTDKDIEEILFETGLQPSDINNKAINQRFDELEEEFKDDKQKLRRLRIQRDVMLGLVLELERRAEMIISPQNDQQAITQLIKELQNDIDIASITIDQIHQNFNNMVEQINDPEKLKHLVIAKDVLLQLVARMDDIKEQEKQTRKKKKKKPHEDESSKTKIG